LATWSVAFSDDGSTTWYRSIVGRTDGPANQERRDRSSD
jgi:hypothetical protein